MCPKAAMNESLETTWKEKKRHERNTCLYKSSKMKSTKNYEKTNLCHAFPIHPEPFDIPVTSRYCPFKAPSNVFLLNMLQKKKKIIIITKTTTIIVIIIMSSSSSKPC